ncbi:hypothetical protein PanWU01x14_212200, partial [Parasponia andersonii]
KKKFGTNPSLPLDTSSSSRMDTTLVANLVRLLSHLSHAAVTPSTHQHRSFHAQGCLIAEAKVPSSQLWCC